MKETWITLEKGTKYLGFGIEIDGEMTTVNIVIVDNLRFWGLMIPRTSELAGIAIKPQNVDELTLDIIVYDDVKLSINMIKTTEAYALCITER